MVLFWRRHHRELLVVFDWLDLALVRDFCQRMVLLYLDTSTVPKSYDGVRRSAVGVQYRINWENPEYASKDKEGVANRYPL